MEELITFDFTIIYYKKVKNPINGLSRRSDFKDNNELSITKYQSFLNFLSKFKEHLEDVKNDLLKNRISTLVKLLYLETF